MRSEDKQARLQQFEESCRERGLSLTVQRRVILEAVLDEDDHPTADQVYELVKDRIPGVSRTTVYRVLQTLVRVGAVTKICHPGASARFDPKIDRHHHLVCLHCDAIVDIEDERLNQLALPEIRQHGFDIQEFHIHFRGVCPNCRKNAAEHGKATRKTTRDTSARSVKRKDESKPLRHRRNKP